jgi:hypothetical protein
MLYWVGTYALIVLIILVPFVLLYTFAVLTWLGVKGLCSLIRVVSEHVHARTAFSRQRWHLIHR